MSLAGIGAAIARLGSATLISAAGYAYWYRPINYKITEKPRREASPLISRIDILDVRPYFNLNCVLLGDIFKD